MRYNTTKHFKFYGDTYYNDDIYGRDRIKEKFIILKNVPLFYGEIDWGELTNLITDQEYAYAVTSKNFHEINDNNQTLH